MSTGLTNQADSVPQDAQAGASAADAGQGSPAYPPPGSGHVPDNSTPAATGAPDSAAPGSQPADAQPQAPSTPDQGVATPPAAGRTAEGGEQTTTPAGTETPPVTGIRQIAQQIGVDAANLDDAALMQVLSQQIQQQQALASQAQQYQQLAQYGQQYLQNATEFEKWRSEQQAQQQAEAPAQPSWNPPEFNTNWLSQVERDASGNIVPREGSNPEIAAKVGRYIQWRQDQQDQFWSDPFSFLQPFVREEAQRVAEEMVSTNISRHQLNADAQNFVAQNSAWLYAQDPSGNVIRNPADGSPVLTPDGQAFSQFVSQAAGWGMPEHTHQQYALSMLQASRAQSGQAPLQLGGQAAPVANQAPMNPQQQANQTFLQGAAGFSPQHAASMNRTPDGNGVVPPQNPNLSLEEQMRAAFQANGISDSDIAAV